MIYISIVVIVLLTLFLVAIITVNKKQNILLEKFSKFEASLKSSKNSFKEFTKKLNSLKQSTREQNLIAGSAENRNRPIISKDSIKDLLIDLKEVGIFNRGKKQASKEVIIIKEYIHQCDYEELTDEEEMEAILDEARYLIQITGVASLKLLKNKLQISQNTAHTILNRLEEEGIIGPHDGTSHRNVFKRDLDS